MKTVQKIQAKISSHFDGLGTVTAEMVQQRARELALINGRDPNRFTEADWAEAKKELASSEAESPDTEGDTVNALRRWDEPPGSSGHKVPSAIQSDEQTFAERLVEHGVEEANHEQMLEGSKSQTNQTP